LGRGAWSPSNTKSPGPRPSSIPSDILIHATIWPQQIRAENWGAVPLWGRGAGSPSNTMWSRPRPTCVPSFVLIRPTVWPQCTNATDRTGQDRQRTDSIGRTVLQTVAQKSIEKLEYLRKSQPLLGRIAVLHRCGLIADRVARSVGLFVGLSRS